MLKSLLDLEITRTILPDKLRFSLQTTSRPKLLIDADYMAFRYHDNRETSVYSLGGSMSTFSLRNPFPADYSAVS